MTDSFVFCFEKLFKTSIIIHRFESQLKMVKFGTCMSLDTPMKTKMNTARVLDHISRRTKNGSHLSSHWTSIFMHQNKTD